MRWLRSLIEESEVIKIVVLYNKLFIPNVVGIWFGTRIRKHLGEYYTRIGRESITAQLTLSVNMLIEDQERTGP